MEEYDDGQSQNIFTFMEDVHDRLDIMQRKLEKLEAMYDTMNDIFGAGDDALVEVSLEEIEDKRQD